MEDTLQIKGDEMNLIDLTNKKIIVVGASQGIGQGTAILLSKLGGQLILIARNEDKLRATLELLDGANHNYYVMDVENLDDIESTIKQIVKDLGPVDGLVYCAGISTSRPLQFFKPDIVRRVLDINLNGFIEIVRCLTKKNRFNPGMRIVGISSIASIQGDKTHTIYAASKAALDSAVKCMAKELADKNICVNTVAPAFIKTAMYDSYINHNGQEAVEKILNRQYLGLGYVEDVANAIAFLISPAARFITGICLPVDGGATTN